MFWAWSTASIILLLFAGGYFTLDGLAGSMSDTPNESSGKVFIWGLILLGFALAVFIVQIVVWFRS